jgi:UDP-N-acetylmuramoyl-tripeptide--D-alanyl-D-alanine ligase
MNPTPLAQIAQWAGGRLLAGRADALIQDVCTDSRALKAGALFVALRGENFDGHQFIAEAARIGAAGAIVEKAPAGLPADFGIIEVSDTLTGLQALGGNYRSALSVKVIGITGSNGKTSTKDAAAAVLGRRYKTAKTEGNLNNHIGVPLTLLALDASHEAAVVEMGMNHAGEIAPLAAMAKPDAAIITNIGVAHIEFMGSREAIAQEKGVLAEAVPDGGTVVLNADDDFTTNIAARCRGRVLTAGLGSGDVRGSDLQPSISGTKFRIHVSGRFVDAELPVPGEHMVRNALLAVATGLALGISLEECAAGLGELQLSKGRLQQKEIGGLLIMDDSYNANPDSMAAGLATLAQLPGSGRRIAVLGRMGELGHEAERGHRRVGQAAGSLGIACVIAVGDEARWIAEAATEAGVPKVVPVANVDEAVSALREYARPGDFVLVKGSRSARMERVIQGLEAAVKGRSAA